MRRTGLGRSVLGGATAGIVATAAMSAQMLRRSSLDAIGTPPPQRFVDALWPSGQSVRAHRVAATALHFAIGAGGGALFGAGRRRGPVRGTAFGVLIWAIGYEVAAPVLGVLPPAHRDRRDRQRALVQAHLIYGAVLGILP